MLINFFPSRCSSYPGNMAKEIKEVRRCLQVKGNPLGHNSWAPWQVPGHGGQMPGGGGTTLWLKRQKPNQTKPKQYVMPSVIIQRWGEKMKLKVWKLGMEYTVGQGILRKRDCKPRKGNIISDF